MDPSIVPVEVDGNTSSSTSKITRCPLSQYWCGTAFNTDLGFCKSHFGDVERAIFGNEICPTTGKKHVQFFIDFGKRIRAIEKYRKLNWHWERCNGSANQNYDYCTKDGDFVQIGRFDKDWKIKYDMLRDNQKTIVNELVKECDPIRNRVIHWYHEPNGAWGKSFVQKYLVDNCRCVLTGGCESDMLRAVTAYIETVGFPDIIIVNQQYSKDLISYNGLESLSDGMFFSSKYESAMVRFPCCHVAVFANCPPDLDKMGKDRFKVTLLTNDEKGPSHSDHFPFKPSHPSQYSMYDHMEASDTSGVVIGGHDHHIPDY